MLLSTLGFLGFLAAGFADDQGFQQAVADVRKAAVAPNHGDEGRPLPLFASWNTGGVGDGYTPAWQLEMLRKGRRLLPWFALERPDSRLEADQAAAIEECKRLGLPLTFISTQWEHFLTTDKKLFALPPDDNANVVGNDGVVQRRISPLGALPPWRAVGERWGSSPLLHQAQAIHPNPPFVMFLSNNEHVKLTWSKAEEDRRFVEKHGSGKDDEFKRKAFGDGWIERQRALQDGFRATLPSEEWRKGARFAGYNAFGPETMGRWVNWTHHSLHAGERMSPWPLAWDGGAPSFYTNNWEMATDYTVFSPQVQAMNWLPMLKHAYKDNPNFWFEASLWDGATPKKDNSKRRFYADRKQEFTPERYAGMAQFGLWLLRPRVIREFRGYRETRADFEPFTLAVMDAVDRVHESETLTEFWKHGELVANKKQKHPYEIGIPELIANDDRWFRLSTSADPTGRWRLHTELPSFALALVLGEPPHRRWLVYSHSALGERAKLRTTIPGYGDVAIDSPVGGAFWLVEEAGKTVRRVE
jgi:hypothetical protein